MKKEDKVDILLLQNLVLLLQLQNLILLTAVRDLIHPWQLERSAYFTWECFTSRKLSSFGKFKSTDPIRVI